MTNDVETVNEKFKYRFKKHKVFIVISLSLFCMSILLIIWNSFDINGLVQANKSYENFKSISQEHLNNLLQNDPNNVFQIKFEQEQLNIMNEMINKNNTHIIRCSFAIVFILFINSAFLYVSVDKLKYLFRKNNVLSKNLPNFDNENN